MPFLHIHASGKFAKDSSYLMLMEPCGTVIEGAEVVQKEITNKYHSKRLQEAYIFLKYASFDPENASGSNADLISVREGIMNLSSFFANFTLRNSMINNLVNPLYKDVKIIKFKDLFHLRNCLVASQVEQNQVLTKS